MIDFRKGVRRVGETMSALISAEMTEKAAMERKEQEENQELPN